MLSPPKSLAAAASPAHSATRGGRVLKTLSPASPGVARWAQRFGDALVCVRQRVDASGELRTTTVELVVDTTPVRSRTDVAVALKVGPSERALQRAVKQAGGRWDPMACVWRLPKRAAVAMKLQARIVKE